MGNELNAEQYAHLPEHPMDPFLRIVGVSIGRPQKPGDRCPWGLAFHVVFPLSPRPRRCVRARILAASDGKLIRELPEVAYPGGRCPAHVELYDSRVLIDREVNDVFDVHTLPEGQYRADAELLDGNGAVCGRDSLAFDVGPLPCLKHRIPLVFDGWKRSEVEARYLSGEALPGDLDGDGATEYVHVAGAVHCSAYRSSGELLWRYDDPDGAWPYGSGACVYDFNADGKAEVLCTRGAFGSLRLCMLEGATGRTIKEAEFPVVNGLEKIPPDAPDLGERLWQVGHAIRVVEGKHLIGGYVRTANFRGLARPRDIMLQVGEQNCLTIVAMTDELEILWSHRCENGRAGHAPAIFDADGDGCDEVALGTGLLDHNGTLLWDLPFESFAAPWEDDHVDMAMGGDLEGDGIARIAYSSRLVVDARTGERLWIDPTWHGQNVFMGRLRGDLPGRQLIFGDREYRHSGHFIHGEWVDVRDGKGNRLWDRRFMSMHGPHMIDWLPDDFLQVTCASDLQRYAPNPNCQVFNGHGVLVDVVPTVVPNADAHLFPRGEITQQPYTPHPHGEIDVYACGRGDTP